MSNPDYSDICACPAVHALHACLNQLLTAMEASGTHAGSATIEWEDGVRAKLSLHVEEFDAAEQSDERGAGGFEALAGVDSGDKALGDGETRHLPPVYEDEEGADRAS